MNLFRRLSAASVCGLAVALHAAPSEAERRALISRADLDYPAPVERSEDGLPVGNGRMGSLVWTTPTALKLQINRVDVQPISAASNSFPERNSDYMGGCGFVDVEFGGTGEDVFTAEHGPQHLSVYRRDRDARGPGRNRARGGDAAGRRDGRRTRRPAGAAGAALDQFADASFRACRRAGASRLSRLATRMGCNLHAARPRRLRDHRVPAEKSVGRRFRRHRARGCRPRAHARRAARDANEKRRTHPACL